MGSPSHGLGRVAIAPPDTLPDAAASGVPDAQEELSALRREQMRWRHLMESMHRAASAAMSDLDARDLAGTLARFATQVSGGTCCLVCLKTDDGLTPYAAWPDGLCDRLWNRHEELVRKALRRRRADIYYSPEANADFSLCESYLVAPLTNSQRQAIGAVVITRPLNESGFTERELRAVETLSLMYSASFSRARLFDRLQEWSRSFEMVLAFNSAVNRHLPPGELVKRLVELAASFLKADGGMAGFAIQGADAEPRMATEAYYNGGEWHEYKRSWAVREGAPGYVLDAEFVYLSNLYSDDPTADRELVRLFDVHKLLCVPIRDASHTMLGYFALHRGAEAAPFTWQDAAFLETLGNSTAVAVENARLLQTLELKNREIRGLSQDHVERLEAERRHIARELHDETGQVLVGIKLGLQVLARNVSAENLELRQELERLGKLVAQSSVQLRDLARNLRPPTLDNLGIEMAIEQLAREQERRTGLEISVTSDPLPEDMPEPVRTALYRIAQEALTNVAKHAEATRAEIRLLRRSDGLQLCITDDGCGFDPALPGGGLGLLGMKERAGMLGGSLEVKSRQGEGTQVCLRMPL